MNFKRFALFLTVLLVLVSCSVTVTPPSTPTPSPTPTEPVTPDPNEPEPSEPEPSEPEPTNPTPQLPEGEVQLHFIDVGQGDAVLIQGTNGSNVLYDGGRNNTDALGYLEALGITSLELVIASHPDFDHIGGLEVIIDKYKPKFFMDNTMTATTQAYEVLLESVKNAGSQVLEPTARSISLGNAVLQIIPPPDDESFSRNNRSIGVLLDFGDFEASLTGDAEPEQFAWWQENTPEYLQEVEVYKAAHHGSGTNGDNEASVSTWSPEVVVIGVSATNAFGHPAAEALALYASVNATVFRTDQHGDVVIRASSNGDFSIETEKQP